MLIAFAEIAVAVIAAVKGVNTPRAIVPSREAAPPAAYMDAETPVMALRNWTVFARMSMTAVVSAIAYPSRSLFAE
tara:strand:- start:31612 stop:31839 length:228 start_codon:yes stop_codon:yes gene_type:complete